MAQSETIVMVNTDARMGASVEAEVEACCKERDFFFLPISGAQVEDAVQRAIKDGVQRVIVGGGDGTVRTAAQACLGTGAALGILPLGTTNNTARDFDIPLQWQAALDGALTWKPRRVPVGMANKLCFLSTASIGTSVHVARSVRSNHKRVLGRLAYPFTALSLLRQQPAFRCAWSGEEHDAQEWYARQVLVFNGRHLAGVSLPHAGQESRWSLRLVSKYATRGGMASRMLSVASIVLPMPRTSRRIEQDVLCGTLKTVPPHAVSLDGEVLSRTPLQLSLHTEGLLLLCPPSTR